MSNTVQQILDYYRTPSALTTITDKSPLHKLPDDIDSLVRIVQGLLIHEFMAPAYQVSVQEERKYQSHLRSIDEILQNLLALDVAPLGVVRPPSKRVVGVCHHFTKMLVALLRAKKIPARGRYGFGGYFTRGQFEDHSLCEYWNAKEERWVFVDPQFDKIWMTELQINHNVSDVPHDRFLVAGDAWSQCRSGKKNEEKFGIFQMRGLWFIGSVLIRDLAALNKWEMLQWDVWGGMPQEGEVFNHERLEFFDRLAVLSQDPSSYFELLQDLYTQDERLTVPSTVFNAMRNRMETILTR